MTSLPNPDRCNECSAVRPALSESDTLISTRYGWRLTRATLDGHVLMQWWCPSCWATRRAQIRALGARS